MCFIKQVIVPLWTISITPLLIFSTMKKWNVEKYKHEIIFF